MVKRFHPVVMLAASLLLASCGSGGTEALDDSISVSVIASAPAIATQPASLSLAAGQAATLVVAATGGGTLAYQWRKNGTAIAGAATAAYAIAGASDDAGSYDVVVVNSAGSVTSTTAFVSVASASGAPAIVAQPASQSVMVGASATLTVAATGAGTLAYQWRRNGAVIAGATAVSHTITVARALDAGSYDVVVSNASGSATSTAAAVDVIAAASTTARSLATYTAAMAFYSTLSPAQQRAVQLPWSLDTARKWSNLPAGGADSGTNTAARNGIKLGSLSVGQLAAATVLVKTALGDTGSSLHSGLQAADHYLQPTGGDGNFYIAFLGAPSSTGFWMLQLTGRHLAWNLAWNGSYESPTPLFLGVAPQGAFVQDGVSYDPLLAQRSAMADLGAALVNYPAAKLDGTYADLLFGANGSGGVDAACPLAVSVTAHGALYSRLSNSDQVLVQAAIRAYINTQSTEFADMLLGVYLSSAALAQTYVAYAGTGSVTVNGNYLRIEGPRLWIEFSVQRGVVSTNDIDYDTIWRDKFADYGGKCG
jgi:hypothetical protein